MTIHNTASMNSRLSRPVDSFWSGRPMTSGAIRPQALSLSTNRALYDAAQEPKRLVEVECGHYDMYDGPLLDRAMAESVQFLKDHL